MGGKRAGALRRASVNRRGRRLRAALPGVLGGSGLLMTMGTILHICAVVNGEKRHGSCDESEVWSPHPDSREDPSAAVTLAPRRFHVSDSALLRNRPHMGARRRSPVATPEAPRPTAGGDPDPALQPKDRES